MPTDNESDITALSVIERLIEEDEDFRRQLVAILAPEATDPTRDKAHTARQAEPSTDRPLNPEDFYACLEEIFPDRELPYDSTNELFNAIRRNRQLKTFLRDTVKNYQWLMFWWLSNKRIVHCLDQFRDIDSCCLAWRDWDHRH